MTRIRATTSDDDAVLLAMAAKMHAESRYAGMNFNPDKLRRQFAIAREVGFLRVWDDGRVRGAFLGMIGEAWFGNDLMAFDVGLFVEPSSRGAAIAYRLTQAYVEWAVAAGAKEIGIGTTTGVNTDAAARLYTGLGFERVGALYRRRT